jgi:hypothetical protein
MGEWVVPLGEQPGRPAPGPAEFHQACGASAVEEQVPTPGRIVVANGSDRDVVLYAGAVLRGGFADRAVVRTAVIPAGAGRVVTVEPLEPRWWPSGPLVPAGMLDPLRAALLELGDRRGVLAAQARTAAWSVHRDLGALGEWPVRHDVGARGWIVVIGVEVAAASLHPPRRSSLDGQAVSPTNRAVGRRSPPGAVADLAVAFLDRLVTDVEWAAPAGEVMEGRLDDSAIRLTLLGGAGAHLTAARLSDELTTAAVRGSLDLPDRPPPPSHRGSRARR